VDPVVKVRTAPDGKPLGAAAVARIEHPVSVVWAAVSDVERYAKHLPMVHRVRRRGDDVTFELRFKIGFFSVGFQFDAHATYEAERWLELRWTAGEPRDIRLRFTLTPTEDGRGCTVEGDGEFDMMSLGWLAKYFLRHHPEIQFGILPGVALVLIDSLRRAADEVAQGHGSGTGT
jgi:ribosome-associated toxin RatA of RatAB toxin-antitoxin module